MNNEIISAIIILFIIINVLFCYFKSLQTGSKLNMEATKRGDNRVVSLDIFRGIAIINILFIHTVWWHGTKYIAIDSVREFSLLIDVPFFFFLAGWSASHVPNNIKLYFRRFVSLYIPYLFLGLLIFSYLYIFRFSKLNFVTFISNWGIFNYTKFFGYDPFIGALWFLKVYISIFLISPALKFIAKFPYASSVFLCFLLFLITMFSFGNPGWQSFRLFGIWSLRQLIFFSFFYYIGIISKKTQLHFLELCLVLIILTTGVLINLQYFDFAFSIHKHKFPPAFFYLTVSSYSVTLALFFKTFENKFNLLKTNFTIRFLEMCGQRSYYIFLYQGFTNSIMIPWIIKKYALWHPFPLMCLCFLVNILGTLLIVQIIIPINIFYIQKSGSLFFTRSAPPNPHRRHSG